MLQNKKNYEQKCRECDTAEESYSTMHQAVTYTKKEIEKVGECLSHYNEILENVSLIWATTRENLSLGVCEQQRCRPDCPSTQSDQRYCIKLATDEISIF